MALAQSDLLADGSLGARFMRHWSGATWPQLRDLDGRWIPSLELEERTRGAARALLGLGLRAGDRLVICAESSVDLIVAHVASLRAGVVAVPINPSYTKAEVRRIVQAATPHAALVDDRRREGWIAAAVPEPIPIRSIRLERGQADAGLDACGPDDPALLVFTSGTTGAPKGALLSHGNLLSSATAVGQAWRWAPQERLLLTLPLFHVHGLGVGVIGSLCAGASIVLRPRFDPDDVAKQSKEGVELFFGVPTMYQRLATTGNAGALSALRLLVSGSAPLPAALADAIAKASGQIPLERYGMTETMMLTANPYEGERRPGTVGRPLAGVQLRLAGDGEVQVRGPNVMAGYYRQPEADAEAFTEDGWFRTGDLGQLDEENYLTIAGRSKELIITGGFNVHPREVEEVLAEHPEVREVAVVGRRSERWGEEVTAVVVSDGHIDPAELRTLAARHLAPYKVPKRIEFASELPRNSLGKLVRGQL